MTVDLRKIISEGSALRSGGFTGAVFLTYTLNLVFYEQMIAPVLDQAGCANVLILADPDGYNGALEMGIKNIADAGRRYVCASVERAGRGVQHVKLLLMASPGRGRMLIGSGNLTLHGYGRNLELFSQFEYNPADDPDEARYPFTQAWQLVHRLASAHELPQSARSQIKALQENVSWLDGPPPEPTDFRVWHNYDRSLWTQLSDWRSQRGLAGLPVNSLQVISPYFDRDTTALKRFADDFLLDQIQLYLDPALTNLDGSRTAHGWGSRETKLTISGIGPGEETRATRHVHAKAIVGREKDGAWCIAGSANLSVPALLKSWQDGGNLELVTFRWSPDPQTFDYLFDDSAVNVWPLNLADVVITEPESSDRATHLVAPLILSDLSARGDMLEGRLFTPFDTPIEDISLHFLRLNLSLPVRLQDGISFQCRLPAPLESADAARLVAGDWATPYRWIDQPDVLARHSARTYQVRIKGKLETILGAEQLFQELMNFLWERVEPGSEDEEWDPKVLRQQKRGTHPSGTPDAPDGPPPPGPEGFITDETLVRTVHWGLEYHQPFDRSLLSLRDLLSLVLLRLTTPTQTIATIGEDGTRDEDADQQRQAQQEAQQINVLERLRNFLLGYCKHYGRRLADPAFMVSKAPGVIFQNHFTISRVLREFAGKAEAAFTQDDLVLCFWWIWAPLVWPTIVGLEDPSALKSLSEKFHPERIQQAWCASKMSIMTVIMFSEVFGQPPHWRSGLWDKNRVGVFMVARELANRIRASLGNNVFDFQAEDMLEAWGLDSVEDVTSLTVDHARMERLQSIFSKITQYCPPMDEKYAALIHLQTLEKAGKGDSPEAQELIEQIHQQGLTKEYEEYQRKPALILATNEDEPYCPRCGAQLTLIAENSLKQGELVLCTSSKDAWIYQRPKLPELII